MLRVLKFHPAVWLGRTKFLVLSTISVESGNADIAWTFLSSDGSHWIFSSSIDPYKKLQSTTMDEAEKTLIQCAEALGWYVVRAC